MLDTVLALLWAPIALYLVTSGLGLLAFRVLRLDLPGALAPPVGLALLIVAVMPIYKLGGHASLAVAVVLPLALLGLLLSRRGLFSRLDPGTAGIAAVLAYALFVAPIALAGHPTWGGYNFVNDTASNFIFTDLLATNGLSMPDGPDSSWVRIASLPPALGYPVGAHALLATMTPLTGAPLHVVYHPLIAAACAIGAMAMAGLARAADVPRWGAVLAGVLPTGAALVYQYGLHGGVKEILVVALLATGAALTREALDRELSLAVVALLAVCAAALLQVFSAVGAAYALVLGVLLIVVALVEGRSLVAVGRVMAGGIAVAALAVVTNFSDVTAFAEHADDVFANVGGVSTGFLGHLLRPLPLVQAAGVWFARDYRASPVGPEETVNGIVIAIVVALAAAGVFFELRRRRPAALFMLVPAAIVGAALGSRLSPYADAKLLVVLSPGVVLTAAVGALYLLRATAVPIKVVASAGLALMCAGVLFSDAIAYRETRLAPSDRIEAMEDAAAHARGGGLWMVNEWEEFAKYFMRDIRVNAASEAESPRPVTLREPGPIFGRYFDLDAHTLDYVMGFPGIIKRRSPDTSRPPAAFDLIYQNDYYEVWRRRPGVRVREHLPLQGRHDPTARPSCREVKRLVAGAAPGDRIVAARRPELIGFDPVSAPDRPAGWVDGPDRTLVPTSPGEVSGTRDTPAGRFRVWLRGSFGRPTYGYVDDRKVGAADQVNGPGQWVELGTVRLSQGRHELKVERPGRALGPGNAYRGEVGPLVLEPLTSSSLHAVSRRRAASLCQRQWDWVEVVDG